MQKATPRFDNDYQRMARNLEEAAEYLRHDRSSSSLARKLEGFARGIRRNEDDDYRK